jgi:hypothetical protein
MKWIQWVQIDAGGEDPDHFVSAEERLQVATAQP